MTEHDKIIQKRMAEMSLEHPGYLNWDEADFYNHVGWLISVEQQVSDELTHKTEGYT